MLPITPWPQTILPPKSPGFRLSGGVRVGPPSLSGLQELDSTDGGQIWKARMIDIPLSCTEHILTAQAMQGLARGGAGLFDVPRYLGDRNPALVTSAGVPHSDGSPFSDGSLYAGNNITARVVGDVEMFSSLISIRIDANSRQLLGGEEFSLRYPGAGSRMCRIVNIISRVGYVYQLEVNPPVREDTPDGHDVDLETPSVTCRMTNSEQFLDVLDYAQWAEVTAEFEEAFW